MRTRFIHDKFILDISHLSLSWQEENTWFKDAFFLTSSFPFDLDYDENQYFEIIRHLNLGRPETYFKGQLEKDGKIEEAVLEVEEAEDKLKVTIRYGIEALPNWDKKISDLVLDVILPDGGNMRDHAETIIPQTYPAVNYNFPAIHTKFYEGAPMFDAFQGVINKRINGAFVPNDADGSATLNRNIVYPFPYFLYVLISAIEDAGYTLHGDILTDPHFLKSVFVPGKKIANFEGLPEPVEWIIGSSEYENFEDVLFVFTSEQDLAIRGYFQIICESFTFSEYIQSIKIKLNDEIIYQSNNANLINFWITTETADNTLSCEIRVLFPMPVDYGSDDVCTIMINTIETYDEDGNPEPYFANFSNVQLATMLPDITVGDLFTFPKKAKNYDLDLRNNKEIWMNLVQNEVENAEMVDISEYDVRRPKRKFEQSKSFLLQYDGEYDEKYPFAKIYADKTGFYIDDFTKEENTTEISIPGIPLPIDTLTSPNDDSEETVAEITTAVQLSDDVGKLQLAKYDGLVNGENWCQELTGMDTYNLYLNYWQKWLNFSIHAIKFIWTIKDHPNLLIKIQKKSKLFSHNNLMFVYSLNRKREDNVEEIEVEAFSSKI